MKIKLLSEEVKCFTLRPLVNSDLTKVLTYLQYLSVVKGIKVAYAAAVSIKRMEKELEVLGKLKEPTEGYQQFLGKINELQIKYSKKKANGEPVITSQPLPDGRVVPAFEIADRIAFNINIEKLEVEFATVIKEQEVKNKNYEESFKEPINIELFKVSREAITDIEFTATQFVGLSFLLKEGICQEDIPEDISTEELLVLMEYFGIDMK